MGDILNIKNLSIKFSTRNGVYSVINDLNLNIREGEILGIVGESGAGKSVTFSTILGLNHGNSRTDISGSAFFQNIDLLSLSDKKLSNILGNDISLISQNPMSALNPFLTVGYQIAEPLIKHKKISKPDAETAVVKLLNEVGIKFPEQRVKQYPHEFSGGMRQRIMIAMALITNPKLLIADEPTTALDVTIQFQILKLLKKIQSKSSMSIVFITHDLGVVAQICSRVAVMYAGEIVETADVDDLFFEPMHPYTIGLMESVPVIDKEQVLLKTIPGQPPIMSKRIIGCPFAPRCSFAEGACRKHGSFSLREVSKNHYSSCIKYSTVHNNQKDHSEQITK